MRDAIILIFANKQDLPEGKGFSHIFAAYLTALELFMIDSSNEASRDPREAGAHTS